MVHYIQTLHRQRSWSTGARLGSGFLVPVIILIVGNLFPYHLTITFTAPLSPDKDFHSVFLFQVMKGFSDSLPNSLKRWEMHETSPNWQATNRHLGKALSLSVAYRFPIFLAKTDGMNIELYLELENLRFCHDHDAQQAVAGEVLVQDARWDHSVLMRWCGISRRGEGLPPMISIGLVIDTQGTEDYRVPHTILHTMDIKQFVSRKSKYCSRRKERRCKTSEQGH